MATFFMFGRYSAESLKEMSGERTKKAYGLVKKYGGEVKSVYALLGKYDLAVIVDFPDVKQAMKASMALNKLLGISFSTSPAVTLEEFDKLIAEI